MCKKDPRELVKKIIESVFNNGELDLIDELFTPNFTVNGQLFGRDGFRNEVSWWRARFPDLRLTIEDIIAEGARIGVWYTACGTHMAEFNGLPSSGRVVCWSGFDQFRVQNDRIADGRFLSDRLGIAHQIGAVLTSPQTLD